MNLEGQEGDSHFSMNMAVSTILGGLREEEFREVAILLINYLDSCEPTISRNIERDHSSAKTWGKTIQVKNCQIS